MSELSLHLIIYAASAVIIPTAVLVLLRIFGGQLSGRVCAILLLACAVRILIPSGIFGGIFTVGDTGGGDIIIIEGDATLSGGEVTDDLPTVGDGAPDGIIMPQTAVPAAEVDVAAVIAAVWLIGAIAVFVIRLAAEVALSLRERKNLSPATSSVEAVYLGVAEELRIFSPPPLRVARGSAVPHLSGLIRKQIVIGEAYIGGAGICDVLRHELTHYKRHHIEAKLIMMIAASVFWWNPAAALLARRFDESLELVTDELVLSGADEARRIEYAETVLSVIKRAKTRHAPLSTELSSHSGKRESRRFAAMLDTKKRAPSLPIIITAAVLFSTSLLLVGCKSADAKKDTSTVFYIDSEAVSADRIKELSDLPKSEEYEGYRQIGWSVGTLGGEELKLQAIFTPESYILKLVYNSELGEETVALPYGAELPTPTRDGAEFGGWFADAALTEPVKRVPARDVTLYAAWRGESSPCDFIYRSTDAGLAIAEYVGDGGRVVIPEWVAGKRIVAICDGAFAESRDITEVIIAKNVTRVGLFAFQRCFSLKSVTLHSGVGYIDRSVFDACYELDTVSYFGGKESFAHMCPYLPDGVNVNYIGDEP